MEKKTDLRIIKSKNSIKKAFLELMSEKAMQTLLLLIYLKEQ